jgi:hypothetical protein
VPLRYRPTIPVDEYVADRVPVFLDRSDLAYLASHCCCADDADEATRARCLRIRFRCMAAAHKLDARPDEVRPDIRCDFVALITLVPSDRGGRKSGITSGYRPQLFIDGEDCDVEITLDVEPFNPGESRIVYGSFFRPEIHLDKLVVGKVVLLREGARTVGYGPLLWRRSTGHDDALERPSSPEACG